jgi:hypothetical protein
VVVVLAEVALELRKSDVMKDFLMTKGNKRCLGNGRATLMWGRSRQWKQSRQENHMHKFNVPMLQ